MKQENLLIDAFVRDLHNLASRAQNDVDLFKGRNDFSVGVLRLLADEINDVFVKFYPQASKETRDELYEFDQIKARYGINSLTAMIKKNGEVII